MLNRKINNIKKMEKPFEPNGLVRVYIKISHSSLVLLPVIDTHMFYCDV